MIECYLQYGEYPGPYLTKQVEIKEKVLWWQYLDLQYTATGYGKKIPTRHMIKNNGRWYRVYCCIFSNNGTLYIIEKGQKITVQIYN